ncbi:hypothetical protein FBU30_005633 [Linnemannia zychae]|nr:hypothetical protein FBU30_005633 [Linnemannia zychae]
MAQTAARPLSSSNNICKSVQFSRFIKISFTYPGDEYDRTALEPAKLSFSEVNELMQLRIDWKQELNKRMQQQALQEQQQLQSGSHQSQDCEDDFSSDESTSSTSGRSILSNSSTLRSGCLRSSSSMSIASNKSCNNGPSSPIDCNGSGSLSDDEDGEYHQNRAKALGSSGMMHRHSEFHQPTENMPCLA